MTALSKERLTNAREGHIFGVPLAAGAKVFQGGVVVLNATGYGKAALTAVSLIAAGVAQETVDNTGGADGALRAEVQRGVFGLVADASVTQAIVGKTVYLMDDQTVHATDGAGTRSAAGTLVDLESTVAWVRIGF
jgi:hypothetical protein